MAYETILYDQTGGVLTVTLNRPDKLNAANDTLLGELNDAFKQAGDDAEVRAVILTGAGRGFCPGQDLASVKERGVDTGSFHYGEHLRKTWNPLIRRMTGLPKPIIGAINGVAAGAGMSLALACDARIAAQSATFIQAFVKIGLIPDSGSTWLLPRLIGSARALEMFMTGRTVNAQQALLWGLVNQVVEDGDLMTAAHEWAEQLALAPTRSIGYIKRSFEHALTHSLDQTLEYEADMQDMAGTTADHLEGLAAFLEKRPAKFKGE